MLFRISLATVVAMVFVGCDGIDNSGKSAGASPASGGKEQHGQQTEELSPNESPLFSRNSLRRMFPVVYCRGEVNRSDDANMILTEISGFAEHANKKMVALPGFEQDQHDGMYIATTYSFSDLREKCIRGLKTKFHFQATAHADVFGKDTQTLLRDYKVNEAADAIRFFVLTRDNNQIEISVQPD